MWTAILIAQFRHLAVILSALILMLFKSSREGCKCIPNSNRHIDIQTYRHVWVFSVHCPINTQRHKRNCDSLISYHWSKELWTLLFVYWQLNTSCCTVGKFRRIRFMSIAPVLRLWMYFIWFSSTRAHKFYQKLQPLCGSVEYTPLA